MNKEFKFWCKGTSPNPNFNKKGWWAFPNYLLSKYYSGLSIFESEDFVSCQSTGLTDSTGKKIFEGDIIQGQIIGPVEFFLGEFTVGGTARLKDWLPNDPSEIDFDNPKLELKVIGNIFETPELLKP